MYLQAYESRLCVMDSAHNTYNGFEETAARNAPEVCTPKSGSVALLGSVFDQKLYQLPVAFFCYLRHFAADKKAFQSVAILRGWRIQDGAEEGVQNPASWKAILLEDRHESPSPDGRSSTSFQKFSAASAHTHMIIRLDQVSI